MRKEMKKIIYYHANNTSNRDLKDLLTGKKKMIEPFGIGIDDDGE